MASSRTHNRETPPPAPGRNGASASARLERENRGLRAVVEFGRRVRSELDLKVLLSLIPQEVVAKTRYDAAAIFVSGPNLRLFNSVGGFALPPAFLDAWHEATTRMGETEGTELAEGRRSRDLTVYGDVERDTRLGAVKDAILSIGMRSAVAAPLVARNEFLGVLVVYGRQPRGGRTAADEDLQAMADEAAITIQNAAFYAQTQRELRRREALRRVVADVSSELDLGSLLERVTASAVELLHATSGSISLADRAGKGQIRAVHNLPQELVGLTLAPGQGMAGQVLERREPVIVADYAGDLPRPFASIQMVRAGVAVPIWWQGQLTGVFAVFDSKPSRVFDEQDRETLELLADHVAVAIENAHLYGEVRERLAEITGLQAASAALVEELEREGALRTVAEEALELSGAATVSIELLDPRGKELEVRLAVGERATELQGLRLAVDGSIPGIAITTGSPQIIHAPFHESPAVRRVVGPTEARSVLVLPLRARGRTLGTLSAYTHHPDAFGARHLELLTAFANQAAISLDNASLYEELHHRLEEMVGLQRLGALLLEEHDFDRVLQAICQQLLSLTDAGGVGLALLEENGQFLELRTVVGPSAEALRGARIPVDGSFAGVALRTNRPQRSENAPEDPRGYRPSITLGRTQTIMSVPMKTRQRTVGVISIYNKRGGETFTERDAELATLFANQAAVAIENARLYEQTREYAVIEERNRLARDLHDSVTQSLFSVTLLSQAALSLWERDPTKARDRLERASELARGALAEMRALIFELRPMALQEEGFVSALKKHVAALRSRESLDVSLNVEGPERRVSPDVEEAAFRIVQESLNNVIKHARATRVTVTASFEDTALRIWTEDDGVGFNPAGRPKLRTMGMTSMRERAEAVGGRIHVDSAPGRGTRVLAELPVAPSAEEVRAR